MSRAKMKIKGVPDGYILAAHFAKAVDRSRNAIIKAVRDGRITSYVEVEGRVFVHATDAQKELAQNNSNVGGVRLALPKPKTRGTDEEISDSVSMVTARRRKLEVEIALKRVELAKATGLLVDKKDVEARLFAIGSVFRNHVQQIPAKAVDEVMAAKTRNAVILVLEDAVNEALTALADELEKGI